MSQRFRLLTEAPRRRPPAAGRSHPGDGNGAGALLGRRRGAAGAHGAVGRPAEGLLRGDAGLRVRTAATGREAGHGVRTEPGQGPALAPGDDPALRPRDRRADGGDGRTLHHRSTDGGGLGGVGQGDWLGPTPVAWRSSAAACRRAATSRRWSRCGPSPTCGCGVRRHAAASASSPTWRARWRRRSGRARRPRKPSAAPTSSSWSPRRRRRSSTTPGWPAARMSSRWAPAAPTSARWRRRWWRGAAWWSTRGPRRWSNPATSCRGSAKAASASRTWSASWARCCSAGSLAAVTPTR